MPKWKARVTGTASFDRTLTVFAADEKAATLIVDEMIHDSSNPLDSICIEDVYIHPYVDEDKSYEICMKVKE